MLERLVGKNSKIEYVSIKDGVVKVISEQEALGDKTQNIYHLGGVDKDLVYSQGRRAKDVNIVEKNYCVVDLDLRKNIQDKYGIDITDEDIIKEGLNIADTLQHEDSILADFDYIVFTGNGLHIYWFGEFQEISPDDYSFGVQRLYNKWNNFWGDSVYYADQACKNIARILRTPGSINQKNGAEVKVIYERTSSGNIINNLRGLAQAEKQEYNQKKAEELQRRASEYEKKARIDKLIQGSTYSDKKEKTEKIFEMIDSIPAYAVAERIVPYKLSKNGKNFDNEKKGYTGYYYCKDINAICNGGSRFFNWGDINSCWSPSVIVKNEYDLSWGEVIQWFKNNFKLNIQ